MGGHGPDGAGGVWVSTALERLAMIAAPSVMVKNPPKSPHISIELPCSATPLATVPHQSMMFAGDAV